MSTVLRPLAELNEQAMRILIREMGGADACRVLSQFLSGSGNYTPERESTIGTLPLDQLVKEIK